MQDSSEASTGSYKEISLGQNLVYSSQYIFVDFMCDLLCSLLSQAELLFAKLMSSLGNHVFDWRSWKRVQKEQSLDSASRHISSAQKRTHRLMELWAATAASEGLRRLRETTRKREFLEEGSSCPVSKIGECCRCMLASPCAGGAFVFKVTCNLGAATEKLNLAPLTWPLTQRQKWAMRSEPFSW